MIWTYCNLQKGTFEYNVLLNKDSLLFIYFFATEFYN